MTERLNSGISLLAALNEATAELAAVVAGNSRRDAELLLMHVAGITRTELLTESDRLLNDSEVRRYRELIARRKAAEPIQYITGEREFFGLRFKVGSGVLIPRPETEHLVEAALERIPPNTQARVADVGTGSGAIAIALAVARPLVHIVAFDISSVALEIARDNAAVHGVVDRVTFKEVDLLGNAGAETFDLVVSNPPYIAEGERETLDAEVRDYEPSQALFAGPTGFEIYERLIPQAARALRPGGWLLMEIGAGQQLQLRRLLEGWQKIRFVPDLQGIPRVVFARRD